MLNVSTDSGAPLEQFSYDIYTPRFHKHVVQDAISQLYRAARNTLFSRKKMIRFRDVINIARKIQYIFLFNIDSFSLNCHRYIATGRFPSVSLV